MFARAIALLLESQWHVGDATGVLCRAGASPSSSAQRKQSVPFGSPVEVSAAMASREGSPTSTSAQQSIGSQASAEAGAAPADSAVPQDGSAGAQDIQHSTAASALQHDDRTATNHSTQQQQQQQQQLSRRLDPEAQQSTEPQEQAEASLQALPPDNWAAGRCEPSMKPYVLLLNANQE